MPTPEIVARVRALLARAVDPGATEEEQRTSAHIAAKLCKQHGIDMGALGSDGDPNVTRQRAEVVINGVRTVVETISAGRSGLDSVFGFDVFGFAQSLLRDRAKETIESALRPPSPARRRASPAKKKRAKR